MASSQPRAAQDRTSQVQTLMTRLQSASPIYKTFLSPMTLTSVGHGTVTTRLEMSELHVNSKGGLHGAVSATIVDFVTGLAIAAWDGRQTTGASVDMHVSYLSAARVGEVLEVVATAERVGGSLAFVTVRIGVVGADGARRVVALGQHTKFVKGTEPKEKAADGVGEEGWKVGMLDERWA